MSRPHHCGISDSGLRYLRHRRRRELSRRAETSAFSPAARDADGVLLAQSPLSGHAACGCRAGGEKAPYEIDVRMQRGARSSGPHVALPGCGARSRVLGPVDHRSPTAHCSWRARGPRSTSRPLRGARKPVRGRCETAQRHGPGLHCQPQRARQGPEISRSLHPTGKPGVPVGVDSPRARRSPRPSGYWCCVDGTEERRSVRGW